MTPTGQALPHPVRRTALHMLRHPDRGTTWAGAGVMRFAEPLCDGDTPKVRELVEGRLQDLHREFPIVGARLRGTTWIPGTPNPVVFTDDETAVDPEAVAAFDLGTEAPLRLRADSRGRWLTVVPHHAAIDGASVMGMFKVLAGHDPSLPSAPRRIGSRTIPPWPVIGRLLHPADPAARSADLPEGDSFVAVALPPLGKGAVSRLPEALVGAVAAHNDRLGRPLRRIGLSVSVVESDSETAVASYRRVDLSAASPIGPAIEAALRSDAEPWEIVHAPRALRLLSPLAPRLSDTLLLSNFGRIDLPSVASLEIYPVARGRSALAFGAVRVTGAGSTLTLRARYLSRSDARGLLDDALSRLSGS